MTLWSGARLGAHEIGALIGEGGMGQVYRARDTRLKRDVAIKVLPEAFAGDSDRLARFQREAEVLATLNHPNIAQIYGLERQEGQEGRDGQAGPTVALVMELVDGPTLADRVHHGLIPLDEALAIAKQIADALETAHEKGIVHRDLKPANIKITPDGQVKVLDFGLAKLGDPVGTGPQAGPNLSASPTMTSPAATRIGVILGTAAYMSPEQARGRSVDKRTDVWAFACVLYEMLTGRRAFEGEDVTETIGAVIHKEPDWRALGANIPAVVRLVLRRCLEKDPKQRMRDIGDVRLALAGALDTHEATERASVPLEKWRRAAALVAVGVITSAATGLAVWSITRPKQAPVSPVRFSVAPPPQAQLGQFLALSPDGRNLAFFAFDRGEQRLWVHSLESGETRELPRAGPVAGAPFWSPDSRFIAYQAEGKIKKIDTSGGPAEAICDASNFAGGSWSRENVIVFALPTRGLVRVPAAGGTPVPLTTVDAARKETSHTGPWFLPGGKHFLYLRSSTETSNAGIYIGSVDAKPGEQSLTRLLPSQQNPIYSGSSEEPGYLLFLRDGTLMAQRFDPARLVLTGDAARVADQIGVGGGSTSSYPFVSASNTGVLAYRRGQSAVGSIVWVSRTGQEAAAIASALDNPLNPRLSPDGRRLAVIVAGDLWVYDLEGRPPIKLTFGGSHYSPLWTPDGRRIAHELNNVVAAVAADGSGGAPKPMSPTDGHYHPHGWTPDGREILLVALPGPTKSADILRFSLQDKKEPQTVVATPATEGINGAALSPDGRWLAYASDETGRLEVWVRPFPGPGPAVRISPNGGVEPTWARNGRELYYREQTRLMVVAVTGGDQFNFKPATVLFESRFAHLGQPPTYDISADGRFVMIKPADIVATSFNLIVNWTAAVSASPAH